MTDVEAKHVIPHQRILRFHSFQPFAEYGGCGAVLQLIAAAAAGAAIAADMPLCWLIVSVCALLPANVIMANDLCGRKQWPVSSIKFIWIFHFFHCLQLQEKNQRTKNVKLLRVQIGMIILFASLTVSFLFIFYLHLENISDCISDLISLRL